MYKISTVVTDISRLHVLKKASDQTMNKHHYAASESNRTFLLDYKPIN